MSPDGMPGEYWSSSVLPFLVSLPEACQEIKFYSIYRYPNSFSLLKVFRSSLWNVLPSYLLFPELENQSRCVVLSMHLNAYNLYYITQKYTVDFTHFWDWGLETRKVVTTKSIWGLLSSVVLVNVLMGAFCRNQLAAWDLSLPKGIVFHGIYLVFFVNAFGQIESKNGKFYLTTFPPLKWI